MEIAYCCVNASVDMTGAGSQVASRRVAGGERLALADARNGRRGSSQKWSFDGLSHAPRVAPNSWWLMRPDLAPPPSYGDNGGRAGSPRESSDSRDRSVLVSVRSGGQRLSGGRKFPVTPTPPAAKAHYPRAVKPRKMRRDGLTRRRCEHQLSSKLPLRDRAVCGSVLLRGICLPWRFFVP
jgi:hypothetical protein